MRTHPTNVAWLAGLLAMSALASPAWAVMHPTLGRWTQRDPAGHADGANVYAAYHVLGDGVDPTGQASLRGSLYLSAGVTVFRGHSDSQKVTVVQMGGVGAISLATAASASIAPSRLDATSPPGTVGDVELDAESLLSLEPSVALRPNCVPCFSGSISVHVRVRGEGEWYTRFRGKPGGGVIRLYGSWGDRQRVVVMEINTCKRPRETRLLEIVAMNPTVHEDAFDLRVLDKTKTSMATTIGGRRVTIPTTDVFKASVDGEITGVVVRGKVYDEPK